jgi:hypothetical protein
VMIGKSLSSGMYLYTGSSRVMRPRSTSCMAQMEVISFVQEAIHMIEDGVRGDWSAPSRTERLPKDFSYLKEPEDVSWRLMEEGARGGRVPSRFTAFKTQPGISFSATAFTISCSKSAILMVDWECNFNTR